MSSLTIPVPVQQVRNPPPYLRRRAISSDKTTSGGAKCPCCYRDKHPAKYR